MPIATPEIYNEMLDKAKAASSPTRPSTSPAPRPLNAALRGFAEAESDGIVQVSTGGAEFPSGHDGQGHGHRRGRARRVRARRRGEVPDQRGAAHRPLPQGQARHLRPAADRDQPGAGRPRREPAVPVAHVGRLGRRAAREPGHRGRAARPRGQGEDHPRGGDRRRRRRGGRRRPRDQREALHLGRRTTRPPSTRSAAATRAATCSPPPSATCTASTSRATSSCARRSSSRARRWPSPSSAWPPGSKPFDLVFHGGSGSLPEEIARGAELRRGEDERRHRHPVRVHPPDRRAHVHQLRRRAEGRRRGRRQEDLRPAHLPEDWPRRPWPTASSRPARTCAPPGPRCADAAAAGPGGRTGRTATSTMCAMSLHGNLLGPDPVLLPVDPAAADLDRGVDPAEVAAGRPTSSLAWAVLAERALEQAGRAWAAP